MTLNNSKGDTELKELVREVLPMIKQRMDWNKVESFDPEYPGTMVVFKTDSSSFGLMLQEKDLVMIGEKTLDKIEPEGVLQMSENTAWQIVLDKITPQEARYTIGDLNVIADEPERVWLGCVHVLNLIKEANRDVLGEL